MILDTQRRIRKTAWQRNRRAQFKAERGYSTTADYGCGGLRQAVLQRDGHKCVKCAMTDAEHKAAWNRPITIDHKDRDRTNNTMGNLQTMCLRCHGHKDITPRLTIQRVPDHKGEILAMRANGFTYQEIADRVHFSIAVIWKWCKRWEKEK